MPSVSTDKVKFQERHTLNAELTDKIKDIHMSFIDSLESLNTSIEKNIDFLTKNYKSILTQKQLEFLLNILTNMKAVYSKNKKHLQILIKDSKYEYL